MDQKQIDEIFDKAESVYGRTAQVYVLAEECSELSAAAIRYLNRDYPVDKVIEEIADVEIMIEQFCFCREYRDLINRAKKRKLKRLKARLFGLENR